MHGKGLAALIYFAVFSREQGQTSNLIGLLFQPNDVPAFESFKFKLWLDLVQRKAVMLYAFVWSVA